MDLGGLGSKIAVPRHWSWERQGGWVKGDSQLREHRWGDHGRNGGGKNREGGGDCHGEIGIGGEENRNWWLEGWIVACT